MKTWTEWQREENQLLGKEEENQQKRKAVQCFQEAYTTHFQQGLRFVEDVSWRYRKNDRAILHNQMQERVFSLSQSIQEQLAMTDEKFLQEKRELGERLNEVAWEKRKASLDEREDKV